MTEPGSMPAPLPADAITTGEAIAILAGKPLLQNSRAYIRHQGRLVRGAKQGRLTEHKLGPGRPRYWSHAEVLALRDSLAADGFTAKPPSGYHARTVKATTRRAEQDGLVSLADAAELAGVTIAAARRWTEQPRGGPRFGARKIGGLWFFERAQVEAYRRPAAREPPETIPCVMHCGRSVTMTAAKARRAREAANVAGEDELLVFCPECWATPEARSLAHSRRVWQRGYSSPGRSRGLTAQWADGKRDMEAHIERTNQGWRSPTGAVGRVDKMTQTRYGHPLPEEGKAEVASNAMSRATRSSDRSRSARKVAAKVVELWPMEMSQMAIANELHVTPQRVGQIAREEGLPPRPRGRPARM
jgi:hypothetical protein